MKDKEEKLTPVESVGISWAISQLGWLTMAAQGGLDISYNAALKNMNPSEINTIFWAVTLIGTSVGMWAQKRALEHTSFTTDPLTTAVYSRKHRFSEAFIASTAYGIISNPVTLYSLRSIFVEGRASNEVWANMIAASTIGLFYTGLNFLIANGKEEDAVKIVNFVADHTVKPLNHAVMDELHGKLVIDNLQAEAKILANFVAENVAEPMGRFVMENLHGKELAKAIDKIPIRKEMLAGMPGKLLNYYDFAWEIPQRAQNLLISGITI